MTPRQELKALPILVRHSPGMALKDGTYLISDDAAKALRAQGVRFTLLCRDTDPPRPGEDVRGERV
jgi:hypothetical protein